MADIIAYLLSEKQLHFMHSCVSQPLGAIALQLGWAELVV